MKKITKIIASGITFVMLFMALSVSTANAGPDNPFGTYIECAKGCIQDYDQWTWERSICAADCYVVLLKDLSTM